MLGYLGQDRIGEWFNTSDIWEEVDGGYRFVRRTRDTVCIFMSLDNITDQRYLNLHEWSLEYKTYPDFKVSEQRIKEGVKYYQVKNYDNIFKDKLQRTLDKSNLLVDYHGMWDLEDLDSRLNGNWLLFVMEFNEKIIGWNWDVNKISTYENKTGGLI